LVESKRVLRWFLISLWTRSWGNQLIVWLKDSSGETCWEWKGYISSQSNEMERELGERMVVKNT
jgi:hypothetical protein